MVHLKLLKVVHLTVGGALTIWMSKYDKTIQK